MKRLRLEHRIADDARLLWAIAGAVLVFGMYAVRAHYRPAITAAYARGETFYARMGADERLLRREPALKRAEGAALKDLRAVDRSGSFSLATARFIGNLQTAASECDVRVTKLEPGSWQRQGATPAAAGELLPQAMTIEAQGPFVSLLRFIARLGRHGSLVQVTGTQFALAGPHRIAGHPVLKVTISAVLYVIRAERSKEAHNATAD